MGRPPFLRAVSHFMAVGMAVGVVALAAPAAAAANPACGATLTSSVKLTGDMSCSGTALTVGKPGITINLNGYTLSGSGELNGYYGVYNDGYNKVTVENGTIEDYDYGLLDEYTTGAKVVDLKANHDFEAIDVWYSQTGLVEHSSVHDDEYGTYLYENNRVNVTDSKATDSDYGIFDYDSLATLDKVKSLDNDYGFYIDYPLRLGKSYYTIEKSIADNNYDSGFYIENYQTLYSQADLLSNTANDNSEYGFYAELKTKGKGNHATGNGTANCFNVSCS